ncbi:MAG: extracellular solute-binding protein [Treponema sp.]|nr:extracellular solute-binding protein [Treponema sp.]
MKRVVSALFIMLVTAAMVFASAAQQAPAPAAAAAPTKIVVEIFDRGTDGGRTQANNNVWTQWIHDKVLKDLNIDVSFFPVGRWSEDTDIINLMASGNAPDLCYTYNTGMIASFRDQGGILDVSGLIDRLLPDMKKLLGKDPAIVGQDFIYRDQDPITKKIYSIPSYVTRLSQRNIFIRQDWLDKLGLPLPKTTQQFHDALVAFRDQDPGNVGKNTVVPFGQDSDARWGFASIVHAFFDPKLSDRDMWITRFSDRPILVPGYKEGMRMMNAWYNEGLIFKDFPLLRVTEDYYNIIKSGIIGSFAGNWDLPWRTDYDIAGNLANNVPGAQFVPVDCIQAPDGVTRKDISDKPGLRIFVPAFSKNQEAALRYLDWLCLYDNFHFLQVGTEGINHQMVNGVPRTIAAPAGSPWIQNSANNIDMTLPMNGVEMMDPDLNARVLAFSYGNTDPNIIVNANNLSVINGRAPVVYQATTTKDGIYGQTLRDKADALIAQAVTAKPADFDRIWDAGIKDYLSSGAQEIMDERAALWK